MEYEFLSFSWGRNAFSFRCIQTGKMKVLLSAILLLLGPSCWSQPLEESKLALWLDEPGSGFNPEVHTLAFEAGGSCGVAAFGSPEAHDLGLASISYGHMWGDVKGDDHWYRGNFEWRVELFGGMDFSSEDEWLVGLTPHLRYNLATGTRWVPFADFGAGVTATGIGPPDLSKTFEFNLQGSVGVHRFLTDNLAITAETRYLHLSCAGISQPNRGLNGVMGMIGVTWYY